MEQEQWLHLKMLFPLGYNLKIIIQCKCVCVCLCLCVCVCMCVCVYVCACSSGEELTLVVGGATFRLKVEDSFMEGKLCNTREKIRSQNPTKLQQIKLQVYDKSVIIYKNRIFPNFQNKVKNLHKYNNIIIMIIIGQFHVKSSNIFES